MPKIAMMTALGALLVMLLAPAAALAITKMCSASPCYGTKHDDTLTERRGVNDKIYGLRGDDTIRAGLLARNPDKDILHGNRGKDRLNSVDLEGRDELYGGRGHDVCNIDSGDSTQGCEEVHRKSFPA
jgi:hypothetical protein